MDGLIIKKEWLDLKSERKKKDLIVELIQLEPSHLAVDWILDQVIKWMKDHEKNKDYLSEAFISKGVRNTLTEKQRENPCHRANDGLDRSALPFLPPSAHTKCAVVYRDGGCRRCHSR